MAKDNITEMLKLEPAIRKQLEDSGATIDSAKKRLAALRKLGIDTTALDDKIAFAETARNTLLQEFS